MTLEELDVALEELETRLERLRALYEQYFLGFEKIEPAVARKDVDRRIYVLRREKIRNTGKRFKLQTIIQRYNTFQQYWQRICREIENGTYKRHILRAERQLAPEGQLTIAARRRFGKLIAAGAGDALANAAQHEAETAARPSSLPPRSNPPESVDPPTDRPPVRESRVFESEAPTQVRRAPPPKPVKPRPLSSQPPEPEPGAAKLESIELDMGSLTSWGPPPPPASPPRPAAPPPKPLGAARPAPPMKPQPPLGAAPAKPQTAAQAAPPKPKSAPHAAPPPKPQPQPSPPAAGSPSLSDDRVRLLHEKLVTMKRENKEAGQVSLENLSRTLRDTERKLREQHKDRKIDFDVVIRDGKAIVKPTVK